MLFCFSLWHYTGCDFAKYYRVHKLLTFFSLDGFPVQNCYINSDAVLDSTSVKKMRFLLSSTVSLQKIGKVIQTFVYYTFSHFHRIFMDFPVKCIFSIKNDYGSYEKWMNKNIFFKSESGRIWIRLTSLHPGTIEQPWLTFRDGVPYWHGS
jgi:hypothetical protein